MNYTFEQVLQYNLLEEGDILLFRGSNFPSFGWWISKYTGGIHSHAALVSTDNPEKVPMCIEFREMHGSRSVNLESQVKNSIVDVFRLTPKVTNLVFNSENQVVSIIEKEATDDIKKSIISTARKLTGLPYGWKIIFNVAKTYLPFVRLFYNQPKIDKNGHSDIFVCSTFVSYCVRQHYVDLIPYLPDEITKPADLARSPYLQYLFTIGQEK